MPCGSRKSCGSIGAIHGPGLLGLVESVFSAGCGLGETRDYFTYSEGPRHLRSLSGPCRPCPCRPCPCPCRPCLVWSHAAWSLSRLVWSLVSGRIPYRASALTSRCRSAAVASLADNFFGEILAASLDPSRRGIYPVVLPPLQLAEPPAHHLCFIKWTSRLILRPRPRAGKPARGEAPQQQPRHSATTPAATTLRRRRARRRTRRSTRRSVLPTPTRWRWRTKGKRGQLRRGRTPPHPRR